MALTAWILVALGVISAALGVVNILGVLSEPIISAKLTWTFWMYGAIILLLAGIAFLLGRGNKNYEE
jgi:hypothetical protein